MRADTSLIFKKKEYSSLRNKFIPKTNFIPKTFIIIPEINYFKLALKNAS